MHSLIDNTEDDSNYYILTSLCEGGELFDRIVNPEFDITEKIAASSVRGMLEALKYCHSKNIVHRDLKPGMCLVSSCSYFVYKYIY